jgi:hypothetical protein
MIRVAWRASLRGSATTLVVVLLALGRLLDAPERLGEGVGRVHLGPCLFS